MVNPEEVISYEEFRGLVNKVKGSRHHKIKTHMEFMTDINFTGRLNQKNLNIYLQNLSIFLSLEK